MIVKRIKQIINRFRLYRVKQYFTVGEGTILNSGFRLRLDNPKKDKKYLTIGKESIIGGVFIFESGEGRVSIGDQTYIGYSTFISRTSVEIGNHVTIAWGGQIYDHDSHSANYMLRRKDLQDELSDIRDGVSFIKNKDWSNVMSKPIKICDDAWIGMNVIILKGVTIGEGAIIGAGSVVTHDIPAWSVAAGNPAKVVKYLEHENINSRI